MFFVLVRGDESRKGIVDRRKEGSSGALPLDFDVRMEGGVRRGRKQSRNIN
jgi:hypothetical protein